MTHGTNSTYINGKCRCLECRKAHARVNYKHGLARQARYKKAGFVLRWVRITALGRLDLLLGSHKSKLNTRTYINYDL